MKIYVGVGGGNWFENEDLIRSGGGYAVIPASGRCFDAETGTVVTAHELGHAFGLEHDFRDDTYIMSYGQQPTESIIKVCRQLVSCESSV